MSRLPTAPGWYPDGLHPDEVRYWDGHDWTSQWRPRPTWAPAETQIIKLRPTVPNLERRRAHNRVGPAVFTAVLAAALLGSAVVAGRQGIGLGAEDGMAVPIISNPSFVAAANRICQAVLHPGARPASGKTAAGRAPTASVVSRPTSQGASSGTAAGLSARARSLALVKRRLGSLRVDPGDRAAVEQWLSYWGVAAAATARQSRAVRAGSSPKAARSEAASAEASLDDFAQTNAIDHCAV